MNHSISSRVAFCGITAGLMTVIMLLGNLLPMVTYLCPAAASLFLIPPVKEYGLRTSALLYLAVALLSLFLCTDKEAAFLFALMLGWYCVFRPKIQHISKKISRIAVKLLLFNAALCGIYALLLFVLGVADLKQDFASASSLFLIGFLLLGNITFLIYDLCLARVTDLYVYRLRPRLFHRGS